MYFSFREQSRKIFSFCFFLKHDSEEKITFGLSIEDCVNEIRHQIYLKTKLTASAGIACNLRLAKLCSDINKPNGQFILSNKIDDILDFIRNTPIRKINGIGPSTCIILDTYGIKNCQDIYEKRGLIRLLESKNTFEFLMNVCMGVGSNRIEHDDCKKSIGHET
jgi:DNA polymerase kappa